MDTLTILKKMKRGTTYSKLSHELGVSECTLIRWLTGKHQMSAAWDALLRQRLDLAD